MLKLNRDGNWPFVITGYCDHVNHNKLCENINWTNNYIQR